MNPKLLFNTVLTDDNVDVTDHTPPHDIEGALSFLTFEYWGFSSSQTLTASDADTNAVDSLGIYGDGIEGLGVDVSYSQDGLTYTEVLNDTIDKDGASLFLFDSAVLAKYWVINFTIASGAGCKIRNIALGESLELERCIMGSFSPSPYNRVSSLISSKSGVAQHLSKKLIFEGFETQINLNMISSEWGRNQLQTFVNHARRSAYYFSWNPEEYPSEAIYGWTDEDIPLSYTGDAALMQTGWKVKR